MYQNNNSDYGDFRIRAFANAELAVIGYFDNKPDAEPRDKLLSDNKSDWITLTWERPKKGKKRAPNKISELKENRGPT